MKTKNNELHFIKMHGLGNDFVIFSSLEKKLTLSTEQIKKIANRRTGVGCDQLIIIEKPKKNDADVFMAVFNADGSDAGTCGNAARCVARLVTEEKKLEKIKIETSVGVLSAHKDNQNLFSVNMGKPSLKWNEIPLAEEVDTLVLPEVIPEIRDASAVSIGNPHMICFVHDAEKVPVEIIGSRLENAPLFPQKTNVEFITIKSKNLIRMKVWERGSGVTMACGTGACASLVAAARRGFCDRKAEVLLDGGSLFIEWNDNDDVIMTGSASISFNGVIPYGCPE